MMRSTFGTIRKRGNSYEIRYTVLGVRKQETVHGSRSQAEARLAQIRCEAGKTPQMTFEGFWEGLYRPYMDRLAQSTKGCYESAWRCHIQPKFGNRLLDDVRPVEVQSWLDSLSYGQAKKAFSVLRAMCSYAVDMEVMERNLCSKRYKMPTEKTRTENEMLMDKDTLERMSKAIEGQYWEGAFLASAFAGLRREEAFALKPSDLEDRGDWVAINVERGVQVIDGETKITPLKTKDSCRVAVMLKPQGQRLLDISCGEWICDDGFGNVANPDTASCAYKRWFYTHPFSYVPWRNLRNSYTTMLHVSGIDLATISRLLGHSTPYVTYKHYDRPTAEQLAEILGARNAP